MKRQLKKIIAVIALGFSVSTTAQLTTSGFNDKVLVIVNEEVITQSEYDYRLRTVMADLSREGKTAPAGLPKQLLESMVGDRLQIQEANRRGITISDAELDQAIQRYASQQQLTVAQLEKNLVSVGQPFKRFKETVRDSLTISRLTEFYARNRVIVPDYEIDGFIEQNNLGEDSTEYQIAQILIKDPEQNRALAEQVRAEISAGLSFEAAAIKYSQAANAAEGGVMGWRTPSKLPGIFVDAIKDLQVGAVSGVFASPNGLHILKLLDLKGNRTEIVQSNVRHILISADSNVAKSQAAKKLVDIRKRILNGEDFSQMARIYSDDSVSAANGGSLDWVSPGEMVKPFEDMFSKLPLNEVSMPVETQYGVHIIRVEDRRQKNITDQIIRGRAANYLRRQRADREFSQWVRELREQAYIEYIADPSIKDV